VTFLLSDLVLTVIILLFSFYFSINLVSLDTRSEQSELVTRSRINQIGKVWRQVWNGEKDKWAQLEDYMGDNNDTENGYTNETSGVEEKEGISESETSALLFPFSKKETNGFDYEMSLAYASSSTSPYHCVVEFCRDIACLTWRAYVETFRNWSALSIRFVSVLFFAAIISLIYSDLGYNQKNIQDRIGILYFVLTNQVCIYLLLNTSTLFFFDHKKFL
jgi:hypothetical protein